MNVGNVEGAENPMSNEMLRDMSESAKDSIKNLVDILSSVDFSNEEKSESDDESEKEPTAGVDEEEENLYYDENEDAMNEDWMNKNLSHGDTDAYLSCPMCFAVVSVDCQRNSLNPSLFRALFVLNCKVSVEKDYEDNNKKQLRSVLCDKCETVIGICDDEELYEFFNVLPSLPSKKE